MANVRGVLVAALALSACGGGDGGSTEVTVDDLQAEYESAWCSWLVRCELVRDEASCREIHSVDLGLVIESVGAQRIVYDGALAGECIELLQDMDCAQVTAGPFGIPMGEAACRDMLRGVVEPDAECIAPIDCAGGAACAYPCDNRVMCCAGICEPSPPRAQVGEYCELPGDCVDGAYCRWPVGGTEGACAMLVQGEGAACDDFSACAAPLVCNLDLFTGVGQCYRPRSQGEACDPAVYGACALPNNVCDAASGTCVRAPAPGEPCDTVCLYEHEIECVGLCVEEPRNDDACAPDVDGSCAGNLRCGPDTGICGDKTACDPS